MDTEGTLRSIGVDACGAASLALPAKSTTVLAARSIPMLPVAPLLGVMSSVY